MNNEKARLSAGHPNQTYLLATPSGFEPPISTLTGWHVRPLHHGASPASDGSRVAGQGQEMAVTRAEVERNVVASKRKLELWHADVAESARLKLLRP